MTSKELRAKRANIWERQQELLNTAAKENRALSAEESTNFAAGETDMTELLKQAEMIERHEALGASMQESRGRIAETQTEVAGTPEAREKANAELRSSAFMKYIRAGKNAEYTDEERAIMRSAIQAGAQADKAGEVRAMSVNTDAAGGYLAPAEFQKRLLEATLAFGGVRNSGATIITTADGRDIQVPTIDDTANSGARLAENTAVASATDMTFGLKTLKAWKYTSNLILVPSELIQDSVFDVLGLIARKLAERLARTTSNDFSNGDGAAGPEGYVPFSTQGTQGATGQSTSVIYNDLLALEHSIDPSYRNSASCRFGFRDASLLVLKKLKDGEGRPLWQPGIGANAPDVLCGYKYFIDQNIPAMAASAKSILFGDFSHFWIRDVSGVVLRRLDERYGEYDQVGFIAFERHDSKLMVSATSSNTSSHPIKHYANSAA